jgi:hypothetical protein
MDEAVNEANMRMAAQPDGDVIEEIQSDLLPEFTIPVGANTPS